VTHIPAALRTGMPGRKLANMTPEASSFRLPAPCFSQDADQSFKARLLGCPAWDRRFERPFAHSLPLPVSRLLLRGQSSRLISSTPRWNFPQARSIHCSSAQSGFSGLGGIIAMNPLPDSFSRVSRGYWTSTPLQGFLRPLADRSVRFSLPLESPPVWVARFPFAPRRRFAINNQPADHRSRFATHHQVRLFREPLGTL